MFLTGPSPPGPRVDSNPRHSERERERERESFKVYYREKERERSLLGIIHNGGSRFLGIIHDGGSGAAPAVDSASPHYGLLDSVIAYMAKTAP